MPASTKAVRAGNARSIITAAGTNNQPASISSIPTIFKALKITQAKGKRISCKGRQHAWAVDRSN